MERTQQLLVLSALALAACTERHSQKEQSDVVAWVDGTPLTRDVFLAEVSFAQRTVAGIVPQTDSELAMFRRAVLNDLLDRTVVLAAAHEAGMMIPAEQVDREILRLKAEYHGTGFNEALEEGRLSQQELRERTRDRLLVEKYFVDDVLSRVAVTDAEVAAYYKDHADDFAQPEQVRAFQIVVKTSDEARHILNEIRAQKLSFDEAARRFSLSPDAKVGGDLGYFIKGQMPPTFDAQCFSMRPGQISDVVSSDYGFHLFKVADRRPAEKRPLDKVRGEVERLLMRSKREAAQKAALEELRKKAGIKIDEGVLATIPM